MNYNTIDTVGRFYSQRVRKATVYTRGRATHQNHWETPEVMKCIREEPWDVVIIAGKAQGNGEVLFASGQRGVLEAENGRNVARGWVEPMAWRARKGRARKGLRDHGNERQSRIRSLRRSWARLSGGCRFEHLAGFLSGEKDALYQQVASDLNMSEGAIRVAVHRLRQRYRQVLRAEVAHTVAGPQHIDEELRHLMAAVAHPPRRLRLLHTARLRNLERNAP